MQFNFAPEAARNHVQFGEALKIAQDTIRIATELAKEGNQKQEVIADLTKQLDSNREALGAAIFERADLLDWLAMCQDECAALGADLDDAEAGWAFFHMSAQAHSKALCAAEARILEMEAEIADLNRRLGLRAGHIEALEHDFDRLTNKKLEGAIAEVRRIAETLPEGSTPRLELWTLANRLHSGPRERTRRAENGVEA